MFAALAGSAVAYQSEPPIQTAPDSRIQIKVGVPFGEQPRSGFFPLHLRIQNDTASPHVWTVTLRSNSSAVGYQYSTSLAVGGDQRREFDLLIPWPTLDTAQARYEYPSCHIAGPGVVNGNFNFLSSYSGGNGMSMVAVAEPLGSPVWSSLQAELKNPHVTLDFHPGLAHTRFVPWIRRTDGRTVRGTAVRLDELPPDARAFSGLAGLWASDAEWRTQPGARREAMRQWVMQGGRLFIAGVTNPKLPALPVLGTDVTPLGFGEIRKAPMETTSLSVKDTVARMIELDHAPMPPWEQDFKETWPLRTAVGEPQMNVTLIIVFVCVFGILIGPVNLLLLAPPERRSRLFFTVPLLSVGASVLLLGLIAFGDGFGGDGARNVLMLVPAGENRLSLFQEQMVRTRMLVQRSFELPETVAASYLGNTSPDPNEPHRARAAANISLAREGTKLSGDWFRTRAVQGLFLRASIPSRSEVVLRPGATPELLSTFASTLRNVHYVDASGEFWETDELATGRPGKLRRSSQNEFVRWRDEVLQPFSLSLRAQFESTLWRRGYFYAEAAPTDENTIPTLRGINWKKQHVICLGPTTAEVAP